jgi:hypothetical protein
MTDEPPRRRTRFDQTEPERRATKFDRRSRSPNARQAETRRSRSPREASSSLPPEKKKDALAIAAAAAAKINAQLQARKAIQVVDVPPIRRVSRQPSRALVRFTDMRPTDVNPGYRKVAQRRHCSSAQ